MLEKLARSYNIKIIWCPKFHCELNPIEGFWCFLKQYVRKKNDQDFNKLNELIMEAILEFKTKKISIKLWNRFWKCLDMYRENATYEEVLQKLFGAKSSWEVKSHKKINDFNNLLK